MKNFNEHIGLYADHYAFTMAQGYYLDGRENCSASFDYFFRKNPFNAGYTIFAGLSDLLEMLAAFNFNSESIKALKQKGFNNKFLNYLKAFQFKGNISAPTEGEVIFANEPVIRVEGNIIETQLIEALLLNMINFQSLIATKASRLRQAAGKRLVLDFGLRRAQGLSAIHASKAAIIGGLNATSNVFSSFAFGTVSSGTQAHSWVQSYPDELTAFRKYAQSFPENCMLVVDTYNTLKSGIPNAIIVAKEMEQKGLKLNGIRLDSGDLAYLSKMAREILDSAGLYYVKIVASNQLNEHLIKSLIEQKAPIDAFGVGTSLITGQYDAALDGVYKMTMVENESTLKVSENVEKITLPGMKQIYRYYDSGGKFYADAIVLADEKNIQKIFHPLHPHRQTDVQKLKKELLLKKVMENGNIKIKNRNVVEISEYVKHRLSLLPEEHKRFENPHIYKIGISKKLADLRNKLIEELSN
ncbi:MAG: nicotinate phosphoribosyltransferase [Ignavibacteriaceae bacterium]